MDMRAVVLTIARNESRLREFRRHVATRQLPFKIETVYGIDGTRRTRPEGWIENAGTYGCYLSHLGLLQMCARSNSPLVIFEDDAIFVQDFIARWHALIRLLPDNWDMVMLGGQHARLPQPICQGLVRCLGTCRTHGYIVRPRAAERLVEAALAMPDHIDSIYARAMPMLRVYAPEHWLVGQRANLSDVSGYHEPERFWENASNTT